VNSVCFCWRGSSSSSGSSEQRQVGLSRRTKAISVRYYEKVHYSESPLFRKYDDLNRPLAAANYLCFYFSK